MAIDDIDLRILDMLQRNGKLSQAKIAGAVGLTTPSVNERIKKMERHGMIKGFVALLDHEKMGLPVTAYIDVALEHPRFEKSFLDDLEKLLAVQECHYLAGDYAYRLKVKAATPGALADFLQQRLLAIRGVREEMSAREVVCDGGDRIAVDFTIDRAFDVARVHRRLRRAPVPGRNERARIEHLDYIRYLESTLRTRCGTRHVGKRMGRVHRAARTAFVLRDPRIPRIAEVERHLVMEQPSDLVRRRDARFAFPGRCNLLA